MWYSPTLQQLLFLEAVLEEGNFVRAADRLHTTHSTISRSLKSLGIELGIDRFEMTPRGLRSNDVGRIYGTQIRKTLEQAKLAFDLARYEAALHRRPFWNTYAEGIGGGFDPMNPFWANRTPETEKPVRGLLTRETTIFQYMHGVQDVNRISPDSYTVDQHFLNRPGNDAIQLNLLHNYQANPPHYEEWHTFFRSKQPKMLIVWDKNDPFFTVEGAEAFLRDLPKAELHLLDTSHFALEDHGDIIAKEIVRFFA